MRVFIYNLGAKLRLRARFFFFNLGMDIKDAGERLWIKKIRGVAVFRRFCDPVINFGLYLISRA